MKFNCSFTCNKPSEVIIRFQFNYTDTTNLKDLYQQLIPSMELHFPCTVWPLDMKWASKASCCGDIEVSKLHSKAAAIRDSMSLGMDIGCLDMGCVTVSDKQATQNSPDLDNKDFGSNEKTSSATKTTKSKSPKGNGQSPLNALNRFTSQIKKPSHRKGSPLNWFPRRKVDSYLKRKIKKLQEADGINLTLGETLGDSNPHYSRVLREKIAAREAAHRAIEARKAALVEASWCRILRAARIQSQDAEAQLVKAEKIAAEAFEAASALGVIMYEIPNCPQRHCQIETSTANGGNSTTHTVTASFETKFEVDKQVAAAVKTAFIKLASCDSFNKEEFNDLLHKISQNPNTDNGNQELSEFSFEYESESRTELETISQKDGFCSQDMDNKLPIVDAIHSKCKGRESLERLNVIKLVSLMLERLRNLKEVELSSLATIVATCGLNAVLAEVESNKLQCPVSAADHPSSQAPNFLRRMSSVGAATTRHLNLEHFMGGRIRRKQVEPELPSLDKFLVKHKSRLEREVEEAKENRKNEYKDGNQENADENENQAINGDPNIHSAEIIPDLGSILVKHSSKFEKEFEQAKNNSGKEIDFFHRKSTSDLTSSDAISDPENSFPKHSSKLEKPVQEMRKNPKKAFDVDGSGGLANEVVIKRKGDDVSAVPSLDKFLVKHVSRLEREVQEAKNRRQNDSVEESQMTCAKQKLDSHPAKKTSPDEVEEKENFHSNKDENGKSRISKPEDNKAEDSLDKILVKPVHRLEREKMQAAMPLGSNYINRRHQSSQRDAADCEGLDKILVKHVSRLEKEKMSQNLNEEDVKVVKRGGRNVHPQTHEEGGLDQILVKHKSRLEKEKMAGAQQSADLTGLSESRREARERELQETWGGLSLGNSIRPHLSKLERDKAAWIKAEEEERSRAGKEQ